MPLALGTPISAPDRQWTWVPFADALCANGTTTGIAVNLNPSSDRVLLFLAGGGACWSEETCITEQRAFHFSTGYGPDNFSGPRGEVRLLQQRGGFFDRAARNNPLKDASYVYVPYCTGDLHAGDNVVEYGGQTAHHVGFTNMTAFLRRIVPTFPDAQRVILAGSSAGGYGALLNWWQTQEAFGEIRVDLINDSGTPMPSAILAQGRNEGALQRAQWNVAATFPPGCSACATELPELFGFYARTFPDSRGALLSYATDSVLPDYDGINASQFRAGLEENLRTQFDPHPNLTAFIAPGRGHVLWFSPTVRADGTTLRDFVAAMLQDDADDAQ